MRKKYKKLEEIILEIDILQLEQQVAKLKNIDCEDIELQIKNKKREKEELHKDIINTRENIHYKNSIINKDCFDVLPNIAPNSIDLFLSDIPYGINLDEWDVLHKNTNSALLGASPAQQGKSGFKKRGKPINGWNNDDRNINKEYEDVADEIYRLRELKQNALAENAEREGKRQRIAEMTDFLNEQSCELEEYDEQLVRRLIEKVTVFDDKLTVEFKSGVEIDIEI
ncbi:hypothetical protein ACV3M6_06950 [Clostridium perfringens]